jgi:hypothetical protein
MPAPYFCSEFHAFLRAWPPFAEINNEHQTVKGMEQQKHRLCPVYLPEILPALKKTEVGVVYCRDGRVESFISCDSNCFSTNDIWAQLYSRPPQRSERSVVTSQPVFVAVIRD